MTDSSGPESGGLHKYCVYGIGIVSDTALAMPRYSHGPLCHVECIDAPASAFVNAIGHGAGTAEPNSWYRYAPLDDGSTYVRWEHIGEFLVAPDGQRILCRRAEESSSETFQVYLLGQALSFALVKQRFEPLHATAVVIDGRAVAFLGGNGFGKSTLAACFLEAGYRLLTDDLLIVQDSSEGVLAYPGPPRIKLFPTIARRWFAATDGVAMNADTNKLILPVDEEHSCAIPVPLTAIYSLAEPRAANRRKDVSLRTLSPRETFVHLVRGAFNRRLVTRQRLSRQFGLMTRLAARVPMRELVYPRAFDRLDAVRQTVLDDVAHGVPHAIADVGANILQ